MENNVNDAIIDEAVKRFKKGKIKTMRMLKILLII